MPRQRLLDEKDRQIISLLAKNPEASQSFIAQQVNLSQPSVGARIQRLKKEGAIAFLVGMNFKHIGLHLAKVEVVTRNIEQVLNRFKDCPYFLNGLTVSGSHNLCLLLIGEDLATLTALVDKHVRNIPEVNNVRFEVATNPINDFIVPVKLSFQKEETPPCATECNCPECVYYEMERCNGCPITKYYRGTFWR